MRNWGTIVTGFYILVVAGLSPLGAILVGAEWFRDTGSGLFWLYSWWPSLVWVGLLAGGPLILFLVGVDTSRKRLKPRRHILVSAAAAGFALTLLLIAAVTNVIAAFPREAREAMDHAAGDAVGWIILAVCLGCWLSWALMLWRLSERLFDPAERVYRWLIAGSVLELLIAVPSHVIVRQRNDCTAPEFTAFGVATGLAILLMSLGPGALFLYRARMRRLSARPDFENTRSHPDALRDGGHP